MNEQECLSRMVAPGDRRPGKWMQGVVQIHLTRACNLACYGCTQGSQLSGKPRFMTPEQFEQACLSLKGYFGLVGVFGGNPALSPHFVECCRILRKHFPKEKCGLWCNDPMSEEKGRAMRETFNPRMSNLNCHLVRDAHDRFKRWWPESLPFGHDTDSRHSPPWVAMRDVIPDEGKRWELISDCHINKHWSASIGVFRGELRAWFCEIAMAQSILHEDDDTYPDTGVAAGENEFVDSDGVSHSVPWWWLPMQSFSTQVRKHCHECGVPLRGYGELAQAPEGVGKEQVSGTHRDVFVPKRKGRRVELVTVPAQLGRTLGSFVDYVGNSRR